MRVPASVSSILAAASFLPLFSVVPASAQYEASLP
jgi:hypothetical protein